MQKRQNKSTVPSPSQLIDKSVLMALSALRRIKLSFGAKIRIVFEIRIPRMKANEGASSIT
jgi:hypothetical protein